MTDSTADLQHRLEMEAARVLETISTAPPSGRSLRSERPATERTVAASAPETASNADAEPVDFGAAYREHFNHVWHTLRRLGVAERDLEDTAQEVFITAHRRLDSFDTTRPIRPWLSGIAWRAASDERKRARNRRELVGIKAEPSSKVPDQADQLAAARSRALVHSALARLPEEQRIVFIMHEIDGFSMPEIRDALDFPLNTLYSRLRLARRKFKDAVVSLRPHGGS